MVQYTPFLVNGWYRLPQSPRDLRPCVGLSPDAVRKNKSFGCLRYGPKFSLSTGSHLDKFACAIEYRLRFSGTNQN